MPMIVKTAQADTDTSANAFYEMALSMSRAIAESIGTSPKMVSGSTYSNYISYVLMDAIGYPGWCVVIKATDNNRIWFYIHKTKSDQTPDLDDPYAIGDYFGGSATINSIAYKPETCVVMHDDNKDTVLFDVHPGRDKHGVGLSGNRSSRISFAFFFARDVNGDVLCGMGNGHIYLLRTESSAMTTDGGFSSSVPAKDIGDTLHLTKMVNYLSPGYPEMRSAYVSVTRPFEKIKEEMYVSTLYAGGKRWGRAGFQDTWNEAASSDYPGYCCYYPIEPFVNY